MIARGGGGVLLAVGIACAALTAACDEGDVSSLDSPPGPAGENPGAPPPGSPPATAPGSNGGTTSSSGTATNSPAGKQYYTSNVHPFLASACGGCHETGPGPAWILKSDVDKSYALLFQVGYVTPASRIISKGTHSGGAAPALTQDQALKYRTWVEMEVKDGGAKAPPNVLAKLGDCLDETKFKEIGFENLVTTRREAGNNPNDYEEDPNECTGCNATPCSNCHTSDPGSGFVMALGNAVLPEGHTFAETKKTTPPYLQKYLGVNPTGAPVASKLIALKSQATMKDKPYTHPMYSLTPEMESALEAFVNDAIARYVGGQCGK